jgi:hypothetical protein
MLESFEYRGYFWLPTTSDRKVAGTLSFTQRSGAELDLLGVLDDGDPMIGVPRVVGQLQDGRLATVEDCMTRRFTTGSVTPNLIYRPSRILLGVAYEPGEEVQFDEVAIRVTDGDELVGVSGFDVSQDESGFKVGYTLPESGRYRIRDDLELEVSFSWTFSGLASVTKRVELAQQAALTLHYDKPSGWAKIDRDIYRLQTFLSLAAGRPVHSRAVEAFLTSNEEETLDVRAESHKHKIDIVYQLSAPPDEEQKTLHAYDMPFTLAAVEPQLAKLLAAWFEKQEQLQPVFDLYFATIYTRRAYIDQEFITLMQAIETYHRRTSDETDLPLDDHEKRMAAILGVAPTEYREWLQTKLHYANEIVLRKRLKRVIGLSPLVTKKLLGGKQNRFISLAVDTRNYRTHYDPSLADKAARGLELYKLVVRLRLLIEMCLLLELGFEGEAIDAIFERRRRYEEANM